MVDATEPVNFLKCSHEKIKSINFKFIFHFFLFVTCSKDDPIIQYSLTVEITSIAITNPIDELIITHEYFPEIKGRTVSGLEISITDFVILSDDKVTIVDKKIVGAKSGDSSIEINYGDLKVTSQFYVNPIEEITNIDSYLTIPASNSKILVPVVVINYYATLNGIYIDTKRQPNYSSLDPITIDKFKTKTIDELTLTKYGI